MTHGLLPCPFCGRKVDDDLIDTLYPTSAWYRDDPEGFRQHVAHSDRQEGDKPFWRMGCDVHNFGCGVEIEGDSKEAVIAAWNRRAAAPATVDESADDLLHRLLRAVSETHVLFGVNAGNGMSAETHSKFQALRDQIIPHLTAQVLERMGSKRLDKEQLLDLINEHLSGTYWCGRTWSAWGYGTMGQNDFHPTDDTDIPGDLADAIIARLETK